MLQDGIQAIPNNKPLYLALLNLYDRLDDQAGYNYIKSEIESRFNSDEKKKTFKFTK